MKESNVLTDSNLVKATIIIPTYGRQKLILRQIKYWRNSGSIVYFLDGSDEPLTSNEMDQFACDPNLKYFYDPIPLGERYMGITKHLHTPYVVTCDDDNFLIKSSLGKAISFLEKNPDVAACMGQTAYLFINKNKPQIEYTSTFNRFENYSISQNSARDRIRETFANYNGASLHSVMRNEVWVKSWAEGYNKNYSTTNVSEYYQSISTSILGKLSTIPNLYMLQSNENGAINTDTDNRSLLISDWFRTFEYELEKESFLNSLGYLLSKADEISLHESIEYIDISLKKLLKQREEFSKTASITFGFKFKKKYIKRIKILIEKIFGPKIYILIKKYIINRIDKSNSFKLYNFIKRTKFVDSFEKNIIFTELKHIENLILSDYRV